MHLVRLAGQRISPYFIFHTNLFFEVMWCPRAAVKNEDPIVPGISQTLNKRCSKKLPVQVRNKRKQTDRDWQQKTSSSYSTSKAYALPSFFAGFAVKESRERTLSLSMRSSSRHEEYCERKYECACLKIKQVNDGANIKGQLEARVNLSAQNEMGTDWDLCLEWAGK